MPATLRPWGSIRAGLDLELDAEHLPADQTPVVFFAPPDPGGTFIPLGSGGFCLGYQGLTRLLPGAVTRITPERVRLTVDWDDPGIAAAWLGGTTWVLQAGFRDPADPAGANTTDALEILFTF